MSLRFVAALLAALAATVPFSSLRAQEPSPSSSATAPATAPVTFTADVAPILTTRCSGCHHPGGPGPFSVLEFDQVAPRAQAIVKAIETGYMPPWKPEPGYGGPFVGERRISDRDLDVIRRWADAGAPRGDDMPLVASHEAMDHAGHNRGWQLGTPDLVVSSPEPFLLGAGGRDVFRNFAIKLPLEVARYVKGVEFQPGNHVVTHHANIRVDRTSGSLHLDERDPEPGYDGIASPTAAFPEGYFLGWTPGQVAPFLPSGLAWRVPAESSLVVELHLVPSNQAERVDFRIGLYFADAAPTKTPVMLRLGRQDIDIKAGEPRHVIRDEYRLPVDVDVQSVQPHAHTLAKEVRGWATMPDGSRRWLIYIKDWDFHNQDVYRYQTPVRLPKGATVHMEYTYDNTAANQATPGAAPRRVRWGQYTSDEMGDLWLQVLPAQPADYGTLVRSTRAKEVADNIVGFRVLLERTPENGLIRANLGEALMRTGKREEGLRYFREHVRLEPESPTAHYNLATALAATGRADEALAEFGKALELDPRNVFAHSGRGSVLLNRGALDAALSAFRRALAIDPEFAAAYNNSGVVLQRMGRDADALAAYLQAAELAPEDADARYNAARLLEFHRRYEGAERLYREALEIMPEEAGIRRRLAWILATSPSFSSLQRADGLTLAQTVLPLQRSDPDMLDILAAAQAATGDFQGAVKTMETAMDLLIVDQNERRRDIETRYALYRRGVAYVAPSVQP